MENMHSTWIDHALTASIQLPPPLQIWLTPVGMNMTGGVDSVT